MTTNARASNQLVVVNTSKSTGISILLTVLLGPLGMVYSTIPGAIVMMIVSAVVGLLTVGIGLLFTWPICIIWGAMATTAHNRKLVAGDASH